jgi:hypothetical protein
VTLPVGWFFDLSQFRRFGAILCRLDFVLGVGDAFDRLENLGDSIVSAFAGMLKLRMSW